MCSSDLEDEAREDDEQQPAAGPEPEGAEATAQEDGAESDDESGPEQDDADADPDGEADEEDEMEGEDLSGDGWAEERRRRLHRRACLRAAIRLLAAARHDPRARRRVQAIATLAGEGAPKAQKALSALATAHKVLKAQTAAARGPLAKGRTGLPAPTSPAVPGPAIPASGPPRAPGSVSFPGAGPADKWWDILAPWRRGIG